MDIKAIRRDFPYLENPDHSIIFLDNAATTQKPRSVLEALDRYYRFENANPHRGSHYLSMRATDLYEGGREKVRAFLNAKRVEEIVFTRNATESLNLLGTCLRDDVEEGDEILITILEHHSNLLPWQRLAKEKKATLRYVYLTEDLQLDMESYKAQLNPRTKIVSFTALSNVTSTRTDVKEMVRLAKEAGAVTIVDGSQWVPHEKVDVQELGMDALVFSGHKMYSPMGIGVLYGKYELLDRIPPFLLGGEMIDYVSEQDAVFAPVPMKFEAGTQNVGGVVGLSAAIDYVESIGLDAIHERELRLTELLVQGMREMQDIRLLVPKGPMEGSAVSFTMQGVHPHDIATIADSEGVALRSGHHCAHPLHRYFGISSSARFSVAFYNTEEEVEAGLRALNKVRKVMKRGT